MLVMTIHSFKIISLSKIFVRYSIVIPLLFTEAIFGKYHDTDNLVCILPAEIFDNIWKCVLKFIKR